MFKKALRYFYNEYYQLVLFINCLFLLGKVVTYTINDDILYHLLYLNVFIVPVLLIVSLYKAKK